MKRILSIITTVIFGSFLSAIFLLLVGWMGSRFSPALAASLTVCPGGPPTCAYASIQAAVDDAVDGDVILVAKGTYTDVYAHSFETTVVTQVVYIDKSITIRGGYTDDFNEPPNPLLNQTLLDAQGQGSVVYVTGDVHTNIEGFYIREGESRVGGGIYVLSATVVISGNRIFNNTGLFSGGGVYLNHSTATLVANEIRGNQASGWHGGGIFVIDSDVTLVGNYIYENMAWLEGGGIYIGNSQASLNDNGVSLNTAQYSGYGGGICVRNSDITMQDNLVSRNVATYGAGLHIDDSTALMDGNEFSYNTSSYKGGALTLYDSVVTFNNNQLLYNGINDYYGSGCFGGGLYAGYSQLTASGNTFSGNVVACYALDYGGGLYLLQSDVTLVRNLFEKNQTGMMGGGIHLGGGELLLEGNVFSENEADRGGAIAWGSGKISLINNAIIDNVANLYGSAFYMESDFTSSNLVHNTFARNHGGDGSGICISKYSQGVSLRLTNSIVVSHTIGISVFLGNSAVLEGTLWDSNQHDWAGEGTVEHTTDVFGSPDFTLGEDGFAYHIGPTSAALDQGVLVDIDDDIDGDSRPFGPGYDLGADELVVLQVTKQALPNPAQPGETLTYTIQVNNAGSIDLHALITDTLPEQVAPGGVLTWGPLSIASGEVWMQTVVVTVDPGFAGLLVNVALVTTEEGYSSTYTSRIFTSNAPKVYLPFIFR